MPSESKTTTLVVSKPPSPIRTKPTTRSSIRQSLNLVSVSKAFVDVISKDTKEPTRSSKRGKESSSRRSSSLLSQPPPPAASAPRASMGDITIRPPSQTAKRTATPDQKTANSRRRASASGFARTSSDEQGQLQQPTSAKPTPTTSSRHEQPGTPQSGVQNRSATLRPRNLNSASSALPKYRPKSIINEPLTSKPPSPVRTGQRRRLDSSDDEKKDQHPSTLSPAEKNSRPISPLPHRAALKPINTTPPATPPKMRVIPPAASTSARLSPTRPTKIVKTTPIPSTSIPIPRPSSSNSSISLQPNSTPKSIKVSTPKASGFKDKPAASRSVRDVKITITPSRIAPPTFNRDSPSPLSRHSRTNSTKLTPNSSVASGNMSHISEGNDESEDSDADDVELLLAPVATPGAPTPAMPRIQAFKKRTNPKTPSKSNNLPGRENMSYLSPLPPSSDKKTSHLRPPPHPHNNAATRGSILSWEQLAADASRSIGEDEFGRMLADVPAPFRAGAISPSLSSQMGVPESPCLSAIDSPSGGYGSISQVLLPDVTPSPAMNYSLQQSRFSLTPDASASAVDSSTATLLRLQLAAMENTAKERLYQMQAMEEELHNIKQAHSHQVEEMQKQLQYMELQGRAGEERVERKYEIQLQEKLTQQQAIQENSFQETMKRFRQAAETEHHRKLQAERRKIQAKECAGLASSKWGAVANACEVELDAVRSDKTVLSFLLAQIDQMAMDL
ncbi:hypothetical protein CPB83DRAFT_801902 [Crepidotus variabilis]|uniref:Uncharacterized protein n=1 Tax=Crepidotus variabilis TaxID=179855 RepID=A0A9P6EUU8_9AGAR|nr:hypothetical protein CPB83DRAFT_801902 [Crepidotus variabilis]